MYKKMVLSFIGLFLSYIATVQVAHQHHYANEMQFDKCYIKRDIQCKSELEVLSKWAYHLFWHSAIGSVDNANSRELRKEICDLQQLLFWGANLDSVTIDNLWQFEQIKIGHAIELPSDKTSRQLIVEHGRCTLMKIEITLNKTYQSTKQRRQQDFFKKSLDTFQRSRFSQVGSDFSFKNMLKRYIYG